MKNSRGSKSINVASLAISKSKSETAFPAVPTVNVVSAPTVRTMEWVQRQLSVAQFAPANPGICAEMVNQISSKLQFWYAAISPP